MKKFIIKTVTAIILLGGMESCTKNFEEINTNPNLPLPEDVPATNLLAFAIEDHAYNVFNSWGDMNEPSTYSGQLAKIAYVDESRYQFRDATVKNMWLYASRDIKNLEVVLAKARATESVNMEAVALTFQSFIWQFATDRWRDIPFTSASQGDQGVITNTYDEQEVIYPELLSRLRKANDLFNRKADDKLGSGDLLFKGEVLKWQKFANSLRLRMAIRISSIAPQLAREHIEEIASNPSQFPVISSNEDNAFFNWTSSLPYWDPWYEDGTSRDDHSLSDIMINTLKDLQDPRLPVYAHPAATDGEYRGAVIGPSKANIGSPTSQFSRIGTRFRDVINGFSPFMRASEVYFIYAEAAQLGWTVGLDAKAAYDKAVTLSLTENEIEEDAIQSYLSGPAKFSGNLEQIHLQKWISLFKNGQEAWAESRRTDVPLMPAAEGSPYSGHNRPPFRYPYPTSETTLNRENSAPFVASVKDNFWGKKMWWDTRANVN